MDVRSVLRARCKLPLFRCDMDFSVPSCFLAAKNSPAFSTETVMWERFRDAAARKPFIIHRRGYFEKIVDILFDFLLHTTVVRHETLITNIKIVSIRGRRAREREGGEGKKEYATSAECILPLKVMRARVHVCSPYRDC